MCVMASGEMGAVPGVADGAAGSACQEFEKWWWN